ncbi:hypothetical protein YPPY04_0707, partial [Yersinia pestis PY-04]
MDDASRGSKKRQAPG